MRLVPHLGDLALMIGHMQAQPQPGFLYREQSDRYVSNVVLVNHVLSLRRRPWMARSDSRRWNMDQVLEKTRGRNSHRFLWSSACCRLCRHRVSL